MRLPCPYCGQRSSAEFAYHGDATLDRPADDAPLKAWHDFVYIRANPRGSLDELWHHVQGCRAWIVVRRDTMTHAVHGAVSARDYANGVRIR